MVLSVDCYRKARWFCQLIAIGRHEDSVKVDCYITLHDGSVKVGYYR